jgi:hypothetical protein
LVSIVILKDIERWGESLMTSMNVKLKKEREKHEKSKRWTRECLQGRRHWLGMRLVFLSKGYVLVGNLSSFRSMY